MAGTSCSPPTSELPDDVEAAARNGAEGIGLYRTEFLYLNRMTLPSEEEQYETYRKVAEQVRRIRSSSDLRSGWRQGGRGGAQVMS
jgi:hypothetical protein